MFHLLLLQLMLDAYPYEPFGYNNTYYKFVVHNTPHSPSPIIIKCFHPIGTVNRLYALYLITLNSPQGATNRTPSEEREFPCHVPITVTFRAG